VPTVPSRITRMTAPAADILRQLPYVVAVDVPVPVAKPERRVIHIRDAHFVPMQLFELQFRVKGRMPSGRQFVQLYREQLLQTEVAQSQLETVLRCLIGHHGLRRTLCEGITPGTLAKTREWIAELRTASAALASLERYRATLCGDQALAALRAYEQGVGELLWQVEYERLKYDASTRLAVAGLLTVSPLDDEQLLQGSKPAVQRDGTARRRRRKEHERDDNIVATALAGRRVTVLILGGGHDLSRSIRKLGGGTAEYVRVTTEAVARFTGER
jgi:hypothetical protein